MEIPVESQDILQEAQAALKQAAMATEQLKQRAAILESEADDAVVMAAVEQGKAQAFMWIVERLESFGKEEGS